MPMPNDRDGFWIVGTSLDWQAGQTRVSIFDGRNIQDGPLAVASLDYVLPLGLHGLFLT